MKRRSVARDRGLAARQFYALIWKDFVVHKRHYIWTMLEITIPVLVCAMAILSNSHPGKPKLENERLFDPDDYERLYGDLNPQRHRLLVAPNSSFTRALVEQIDDGAVTIELCETEAQLVEQIKAEIPVSLDQVKRLLPDENQNVTIGGVVVRSDEHYKRQLEEAQGASRQQQQQRQVSRVRTAAAATSRPAPAAASSAAYYEVTSKLDGRPMKIPVELELAIRAKDFRLGPEPFPKKYSLGPFLHSDHYQSTFFMAAQIMVSRAYINLLANYLTQTNSSAAGATNDTGGTTRFADIVIPSNEELIGQKMPYPKYVAHKRLKETTLGTFVAGSQKQKPFVLTMDYCICVGFLVTAIFLAKRIVDEKKSRVRDMLRLVGISDLTYYGSHMTNTMLIMGVQCCLITLLFTGHHDAPAQNIDSSLMLVILIIYCVAAIMFVITLSTLFNSSTKAIIFTSLLWLGLPEVIDRIFKMNSGVIESNGFLTVDEHYHLLFCLLPNFGLRLMNRLLTECDIYGEFYNKKELYGEYRAIWPNIFNPLPLYKSITVGHIMGAMLISIPFYMLMIYMINSANEQAGGLANLGSEGPAARGVSGNGGACLRPLVCLGRLLVLLLKAPFKLLNRLLFKSGCDDEDDACRADAEHDRRPASGGNLNAAYASSMDSILQDDHKRQQQQQSCLVNNIELCRLNDSGKKAELGLDPCQLIAGPERDGPPSHESSSMYFERAPGMLKKGVSIRNLCKTYFTNSARLRRIDAVRNVSLDMFYSQILVLLGHNGAGKTTLIDIISGHNRKTSGQIHIDGYDIDTHPAEARKRVGFCPQFDVLFERLTVYEHLYFYGIVKGATSELHAEIEQLLQQSGLDVHRKKLSKALSGGYKRKLSLAIAMIAKSRILILDEPTSGMDPESRRKVWDFLQLIRHDRLILMTTHHMEEADALGDRIAVMSAGQVRCCGSALFLKKVFNAGYHLRISKSSSWNQVAFEELVGIKYGLQDKLENVTPHELMYKFDVAETAELLPALFDDLERVKERVGIFGFGITVSTMDDVFMKIGVHFKDVEAQEMQSRFELANKPAAGAAAEARAGGKQAAGQAASTSGSSVIKMNGAQGLSAMAGSRKERVEGRQLFRQHVRAMLAKRYNHARKNWFQLLWILMVSLSCVASIVVLIDFVIFREELTPEWSREMSLEGAGYGRETTGIYQFGVPSELEEGASIEALRDKAFPTHSASDSSTTSAPATTTAAAPAAAPTTTTTTTTTAATTTSGQRERESLTSTTTTGAPASTDTSANITVVALPSSDGNTENNNNNDQADRPTPANRPTISEIRRRRRRLATAADEQPLIEGRSSRPLNDSALFLERYWLAEARRSGMKHLLTYTDVNTQMIDLLTRQFADFRERYIVGGEKMGKKYVAWYNGEATHSFPISMNIMLNSILKQFTDLIQESGHPMKGSRISLKHVAMAQINTLIAFLPHLGRLINLVFLPFSLAFITSYFVIFPTHERVTKVSSAFVVCVCALPPPSSRFEPPS
jgi:ABC-type multidrug transport system ATPase subunit